MRLTAEKAEAAVQLLDDVIPPYETMSLRWERLIASDDPQRCINEEMTFEQVLHMHDFAGMRHAHARWIGTPEERSIARIIYQWTLLKLIKMYEVEHDR